MRLAVVGVGGAGSRIANRILDVERASGRNLTGGNVLLVNTKGPTFDATERVPEERRLTIGDVHWRVDGTSIDGDPEAAAEVAREEGNEINRAFDHLEFHAVDGVLVTAGLAGATGGGAGAVVIDQLQSICDDPVYAVGVLPSESEGRDRAMNAARALRTYVERADNVIIFDNDAWQSDDAPQGDGVPDSGDSEAAAGVDVAGDVGALDGAEATGEIDAAVGGDSPGEDEAVAEAYAEANAALAERLVTLFGAGESRGAAASENRLDPSDIVRTLDTGGVSSIGYAQTEVPRSGRLHAWLRALGERLGLATDEDADDEEAPTEAARINRLVRRAARSKLTLPCGVTSADRALIVLSGPSRTLSRKGFESGRYWLEEEADVVDVMAGDEPHDRSSTLTAVVLYSNVTDVPRIDSMQEQAVGGRGMPGADGVRYGRANPR